MNGKNILIVGASSGIGHALASQLQTQGATLFTAGRQVPQGIHPKVTHHSLESFFWLLC